RSSGLSVNVLRRCGLIFIARQIRETDDWLTPTLLAIKRVLQCVRPFGFVCSASRTTASTFSSASLRSTFGRGASSNPSTPNFANRRRHLPTVAPHTPTSSATSALLLPCEQSKTIRDRSQSARETVRPRAYRPRVSPCSLVSSIAAVGLPRRLF